MLLIKKKIKSITIIESWFAKEKVLENGIIHYRQAHKPLGLHPVPFDTLISDLTIEEEEIALNYSKNCRYEIRRAQRDGVTCEYKVGSDITLEDITEFCDFFEEFWNSKGIVYTEKDKLFDEIQQYVKVGAFAMAMAFIDSKKIVYHTYIMDKDIVRLYQSASKFRVDESIPHTQVGMANRYLHNQDMLYFKQLGKTRYDWGGAGHSEEVESITKFKESFGGTPITMYNGEEVVGIKAKLYHGMVEVISKITK